MRIEIPLNLSRTSAVTKTSTGRLPDDEVFAGFAAAFALLPLVLLLFCCICLGIALCG